MDELYGDLENYNEVNTIEELRSENQQLKIKLEEYETAMGKLQKDYDKLAMEFHNLQMNYSSLLKTARAEVERKAQTITQLNLANDFKVLHTLQSGNTRRPFNNRSRFQKNTQSGNKATNIVPPKVGKISKNDQIPKNDDVKSERYEISSVSTSVSKSSSDYTKLNIVDKIVDGVEVCIKKGELKENIPQHNTRHEHTNIHAIDSNRRKSMSTDIVPKFSSDDESETGKSSSGKIKNDIPTTSSSVTSNINSIGAIGNERLSVKISETSSIEGRSFNHPEDARDSHRPRINRYYETDKCRESEKPRGSGRFKVGDRYRQSERYRVSDKWKSSDHYRDKDRYRDCDRYNVRDKYDSFHRHRKYSPERSNKRSFKEHDEDYHRLEYARRKQETRDKNTHHDNAKYKHRYDVEYRYDEPNKRQKLESQICTDENKKYHDCESNEYDMLRTSCQSPDMAHVSETHTERVTHTIKEIKNVAATPLDDPRVGSKKYILKTENGLPALYTTTSENIDIKPVDKSLWNIKSVAVPGALLFQPSSDLTDENIKEIYMNLDTPEYNESIESGEIRGDSEDIAYEHDKEAIIPKYYNLSKNSTEVYFKGESDGKHTQYIAKDYTRETIADTSYENIDSGNDKEIFNKSVESRKTNIEISFKTSAFDISKGNVEVGSEEKSNEKPLANIKHDNDMEKKITKVIPKLNCKEECVEKIKSGYKIPKLKQGCQNAESKIFNVAKDDLCKVIPKECNIGLKTEAKQDTIIPHLNLARIDVCENVLTSTSREQCENNKSAQSCKLFSDMAIVRDDLELSDESDNNFELPSNKASKKETDKLQPNLNTKLDDLSHRKKSSKTAFEAKRHNDAKGLRIEEDSEPKEPDSKKKQKPKRKKTKSKEIELKEVIEVQPLVINKTCKKSKSSTLKQIKNTFSDLFGDSSSLITPEDMGIPASCIAPCDTQDAVDINIKEIVKAPLSDSDIEKVNTAPNTTNAESVYMFKLSNTNMEDKEVVTKTGDEIILPALDTNVYQNINSETTDNADAAVKIVIISSGVQPQLLLDDNIIEKRLPDIETNAQSVAVSELITPSHLEALATSTPQKELTLLKTIDTEASLKDCSDAKSESTNRTGSIADQSNNNTQDYQDAPDVRIFVKRRRKGLKRT